MNEIDIEKIVKEILAKRLNIDVGNITSDSSLVADLGMDSFGGIEVVFELEDKFNIDIPDTDLKNVKIVRDITEYLKTRLSSK